MLIHSLRKEVGIGSCDHDFDFDFDFMIGVHLEITEILFGTFSNVSCTIKLLFNLVNAFPKHQWLVSERDNRKAVALSLGLLHRPYMAIHPNTTHVDTR